jgi:hypothetical protein
MASVSKFLITLGSISGASGSTGSVVLEQLTVDHVLFLNVSAFSTTTLTINVMTSPDGVNFAQIATAALTATGKSVLAVPTPLAHVKIDWTMAGGAQTATVEASLCYDKRR